MPTGGLLGFSGPKARPGYRKQHVVGPFSTK
jgi:hypothetical protein